MPRAGIGVEPVLQPHLHCVGCRMGMQSNGVSRKAAGCWSALTGLATEQGTACLQQQSGRQSRHQLVNGTTSLQVPNSIPANVHLGSQPQCWLSQRSLLRRSRQRGWRRHCCRPWRCRLRLCRHGGLAIKGASRC